MPHLVYLKHLLATQTIISLTHFLTHTHKHTHTHTHTLQQVREAQAEEDDELLAAFKQAARTVSQDTRSFSATPAAFKSLSFDTTPQLILRKVSLLSLHPNFS